MKPKSKYEEALERARKGMPIDEVFPELKESEDERIRKALIRFFKNTHDWVNLKYDGDEIVTYLEKQKEPEPINQCNTHEPMLDEARKWNEAYEKGYSLGYENGRNEQQPAEWSEEDENELNDILAFAKNDIPISGDTRREFYNFLKSLPERFNLQPKQEWSEEDEKQLNDIIDLLPGLTNRHAWLLDIKQRLKSPRLQAKQEWGEEDERNLLEIKCLIANYRTGNDEYELCSWIDKIKDRIQPQSKQEWSEEDERNINAISMVLESWDRYHVASSGLPSLIPEYISWLKSLRPQSQAVYKTAIESILEMCNSCDIKRQFGAAAMDFWASVKIKCEEALQAGPSLNESHWKPSEEQMRAVFDASERNDKLGSVLLTLYNDLKKL